MEDIKITERELTEELLGILIQLSSDWEAENSCRGYRKNARTDIEGNRIFTAEDGGEVIGYLFGHAVAAQNMSSVMPEGTPYFEVEEIYVRPEYRSQGIGQALFRRAEQAAEGSAQYIVLSTATKDWKAILHFYLEELDMEFWNARLFKRVEE